MTKYRVMIYHQAGQECITVETKIVATVGDDSFEKSENKQVSTKEIMQKLNELLTLIDAEVAPDGSDPATYSRFVPAVEEPPVIEDSVAEEASFQS